MLVISRKDGEQFIIGDDIVITILDAHRGQCRIGIKAPLDVPIWRAEVKRPSSPSASPARPAPKSN